MINDKSKTLLICIVLAGATFVAFEKVRNNDFIYYDDDIYVTENTRVQRGLNPESIAWAFTTSHSGYRHPLTWISHQIDCTLFALNPAGHHLMSVCFHIANVILLFLILKAMTGAIWPSAFVAAVFGLHPLMVESVAWTAERKNVLSTFFAFLTIWTYFRWTQKPGVLRYLAIVLFFAAGLLSKPMLVTLPCLLILLDYWPLNRLPISNCRLVLRSFSKGGLSIFKRQFLLLLYEKIPLFLLSAISSGITLIDQKQWGAMERGENYSLITRLSNASVSYMNYILKLFCPANLAVLYPHPGDTLPLWQSLSAPIAILLITACVFWLGFKKRYLLVGWLWYLGTLVPVIGLVQVGSQAMANRYVYLPSIGIFIIIAWGVNELSSRWKYSKTLIISAVPIILIALLIGTRHELSYWKNSITLFKHTLEITKNNYITFNNYGCALKDNGDYDLAIENFNQSLRIKPDYVTAINNLGMALRDQGKIDQAVIQWEKALEMEPSNPNVNANMGLTFAIQGQYEKAIEHFNKALKNKPDLPHANYILGFIYHKMGNYPMAEENFIQAIKVQPYDVNAINDLGTVYGEQGRLDNAIQKWNEALAVNSTSISAHLNLAFALAQKNQPFAAIEHFNAALRLDPNHPDVLMALADSYMATGKPDQAIKVAEKALNLAADAGNETLEKQIQEQLQSYKTKTSSK
jgi:protein O-mannosyl-transferase